MIIIAPFYYSVTKLDTKFGLYSAHDQISLLLGHELACFRGPTRTGLLQFAHAVLQAA
jgi:hypothetical protein